MPRRTVIIDAVRTPVGRRKGGLAEVHPADLSAHVLRSLAARTNLDTAAVDDVVWGCVSQVGEQSFNIGRTALLSAGWPEHVPAVTVDRQCGSSQQAVSFAAALVQSGQADVVVAGGVESMTRWPIWSAVTAGGSVRPGASPLGADYRARYGEQMPDQGLGAEQIAQQWNLSRDELDAYALQSHTRAAAAQDAGRFDDELAPVTTTTGTVSADEGVRRDSSLEALAALKTPFLENGRVTAGNASQVSDGAAALLIMSEEAASAHGVEPIAVIEHAVAVGSPPMPMLTGPIPATRKLLDRADLTTDDIGVFEVNEAFASVVLAWQAEYAVDPQLLNPLGGAIALGHPLGGSGARIMTTMLHHMRATGAEFGLQTMCEGGGMANATLLRLI